MPRYLLSCSFRPRSSVAVPLLDALAGGTLDGHQTDRRSGVCTRGWVVRGEAAHRAYDRLANTPGLWAVTLDPWPEPARLVG